MQRRLAQTCKFMLCCSWGPVCETIPRTDNWYFLVMELVGGGGPSSAVQTAVTNVSFRCLQPRCAHSPSAFRLPLGGSEAFLTRRLRAGELFDLIVRNKSLNEEEASSKAAESDARAGRARMGQDAGFPNPSSCKLSV